MNSNARMHAPTCFAAAISGNVATALADILPLIRAGVARGSDYAAALDAARDAIESDVTGGRYGADGWGIVRRAEAAALRALGGAA